MQPFDLGELHLGGAHTRSHDELGDDPGPAAAGESTDCGEGGLRVEAAHDLARHLELGDEQHLGVDRVAARDGPLREHLQRLAFALQRIFGRWPALPALVLLVRIARREPEPALPAVLVPFTQTEGAEDRPARKSEYGFQVGLVAEL